jgi:hypothetical protein
VAEFHIRRGITHISRVISGLSPLCRGRELNTVEAFPKRRPLPLSIQDTSFFGTWKGHKPRDRVMQRTAMQIRGKSDLIEVRPGRGLDGKVYLLYL